MNGATVIDRRDGTLYVRIPPELARPIEGGCSCSYCKAHPHQVPRWDCLAIPPDIGGHAWTLHYPTVTR